MIETIRSIHRKNIAVSDVKCGNIMISDGIKLFDFDYSIYMKGFFSRKINKLIEFDIYMFNRLFGIDI